MEKAIQERASFELIRYANCWEDASILVTALNIQAESHCISIASAGDNSFALLAKSPKLVLAVDLSEVQLACVDLRKAAIQALSYPEYLSFFGFQTPITDRLQTYQKLRPELQNYTKELLDPHPLWIQEGIIHQGKFEKYFHLFRKKILPWVHSQRKIKELFLPKTETERLHFYQKHWNTLRWRLMFKLFFNNYLIGKLGRDPEFFRYVEGSVAKRIFLRAEYAFTVLPPNENPYLNYILQGNFQETLPFYVTEKNYSKIQKNVAKLKLFHGTIEAALQQYQISFDCFNLSNIFEYMDFELFKTTANELLKYANPKARFAYWNLFVPRKISDHFPEKTQYLATLSEKLFQQDQAFFYKSFYVDEVQE